MRRASKLVGINPERVIDEFDLGGLCIGEPFRLGKFFKFHFLVLYYFGPGDQRREALFNVSCLSDSSRSVVQIRDIAMTMASQQPSNNFTAYFGQ